MGVDRLRVYVRARSVPWLGTSETLADATALALREARDAIQRVFALKDHAKRFGAVSGNPSVRPRLAYEIEALEAMIASAVESPGASERVQLGRAIATAVADCTERAVNANVDVSVVSTSAVVNADPVMLVRVIGCLLSDAVESSPPGSRVVIGVRTKNSGHTALVQVVKSAEASYPGLRLLAIAAMRLGVAMGLRVDLRGSGTGLGNAILFLRREASDSMEDRPVPHQVIPVSASGSISKPDRTIRVVVVEDDPLIRDGIVAVLEDDYVVLGEGGDWESAMANMPPDEAPDVLVVDYHLNNGGDGLQVIATARNAFGPIPAILLTADVEARAKAAECGVQAMTKPIGAAALRAGIQAAYRSADWNR